jgi:hypothetical protein
VIKLNNVKIDCRKDGGGVDTGINKRFRTLCDINLITSNIPDSLLAKSEYLYVTDEFSPGVQKLIGFAPASTYFNISKCEQVYLG